VAITLAFRFEIRSTVLISAGYAAVYVAILATLGQLSDHVLDATVRSGFLVWVSLMAGLLGHYAAEEARAKAANYERALSAERAEKHFRELLESCPEAIVVHSEGRMVYVNAAAVVLLGATDANEIIGRSVLDFVHADFVDIVRERARRAYEEPSSPLEERLVRLNGTTFEAEIQGRPIIYQGKRAAQIILRDVSAAKAAERMRRDLVAMMSHDIKNPLAAVMGYVEVLRDPVQIGANPEEVIDGILSAAQQAMTLALNFVEVDRIESGALELDKKPRSLNELVRQEVRRQEARARLCRLVLRTDLSPEVPLLDVDKALVDRVIANLVSNAIKFSPEGAEIVIATSLREGRAVMEVRDRGPGITPEDQPKLFHRYSRGAGSRTDSSGLGLFIVKTIVEAHGGAVGVRCPQEGGSIFEVALPVDVARRTRPL
jgi:PAS domain S-box-containing protein